VSDFLTVVGILASIFSGSAFLAYGIVITMMALDEVCCEQRPWEYLRTPPHNIAGIINRIIFRLHPAYAVTRFLATPVQVQDDGRVLVGERKEPGESLRRVK